MDVPIDHPIMSWLVRHAGFLVDKFMKKSNGKTGYHNYHGEAYEGTMLRFGDVVQYHTGTPKPADPKLQDRWPTGVWVGRQGSSNEHILLTGEGVKKSRRV